jgi:hypothetical protein
MAKILPGGGKTNRFDGINHDSANRQGSRLQLGIRETAPKDRTPAAREEMKTLKRVMAGKPDTVKSLQGKRVNGTGV